MPCSACGCACNTGGEATREELGASLLDLEKGAPLLDLEKDRGEEEVLMRLGARFAKFVFRGLMILLWASLFNSMKRYAINYIGGDTWFSTFAVVAVAIPIAEVFCILGMCLSCAPPK